MSSDTPLAGVRVVDLSQGIAGPYCAMLLAQHGADVIKVEPPEGDWSRTLGTRYGDQTAFSVVGNLGKRSIALDLKQRADHAVLERLARGTDVFDFLAHPHVRETGAIAWLEQPAVGKVPMPRVPGLPRLGPGDRRGTAPGLDQHRAEILRELDSTG